MFKIPLFAISTALLVSSCAFCYATSPPAAGASPDPDALLKTMSTRLTSTKQYRFTVSNTVPEKVAAELHQQPKADVEVVVTRPDKLAARITNKGSTLREMIFDGRTFTVVDGVNHFYSQVPLRGSLDEAASQMAKVYGFRPPLAEFIISDSYRDIRSRFGTVSYLGEDTVRQSGRTVQCHRIGLPGKLADVELWLGTEDSLPRRLKATRKNSGGKDLLVDINFLTWDLNSQVSASAFRYQPAAGAEKIPMVSVAEANAPRTAKSNPKPAAKP
jgi:hypothetical protein